MRQMLIAIPLKLTFALNFIDLKSFFFLVFVANIEIEFLGKVNKHKLNENGNFLLQENKTNAKMCKFKSHLK